MNNRKYIAIMIVSLVGMVMSCVKEDLFPLPYNDRNVGAYLRMYKISNNVFDLNDIAGNAGANTGFNVIWEAVDEANGDNLEEIEFFVTMRRGTGITSEALVKTVTATAAGFASVPEPTNSIYKRAQINLTYAETLAALLTTSATPPATWLSGATGLVFPGSFLAADQITYRWNIRLKDGREFTVLNPQGDNPNDNNNTANITGGQFYSAPSIFTVFVRSLVANSWRGTYTLTQRAIWSPSHSVALHTSSYPSYMNEVLFPTQTVTLEDFTTVSGLLSTERQFTVSYRGSSFPLRINLEQTGPGLNAATVAVLNTAGATGLGFTGATTTNLGTVFVPVINSTVNCTADREIYMVTPATGTFTGSTALQLGLPQFLIPNRGVYRNDIAGTTAGDTFSISVDDDCDEYGRRYGYCTWYRRVYLTLVKQ